MFWFFYYFYNKVHTSIFWPTCPHHQYIHITHQQINQQTNRITHNKKTYHKKPPKLPHHKFKITILSLLTIILATYYTTTSQKIPTHTNNPHQHKHTHNIPTYKETILPYHKVTTTHIGPTIHTIPYPPQQPQTQHTIHINIQHTNIYIIFYTIKHPQNKHTTLHKFTTHIMDLQTLILLGGDIHPNPGPTAHVTKNLPKDYKQRQKHFFISNTTTLKPSYTHLEELFSTHLTQNLPNQDLIHIHRHKPILSQYPLQSQIYTLIIAYGPTPQICDQHMTENIDPRCLTILKKLQNIAHTIPPRTQQLHPTHHHTTPTTIAQTYTHINEKIANKENITMTTLQKEIPHIPQQILLELSKCTQTIHGYHPTHDTTHHTPSITTNIDTEDHQTSPLKIITWNTGCISSSLPGIQELARTINKDPHIILIQETKLQKLKSTTYIDKKFPNYKIIYNNSNITIPNQSRYSGENPARGGTLTMIPHTIYTNENIVKIPTPSKISPYLQIIIITNKPITPILLINMYMPTHPQDLHLILEIQDQIQKLVQNHPTHHIILGGDFNRDILLKGRSHHGIISPPNPQDHEWAHFTQRLGLNTIDNHDIYTRQGGHNYTATSHIDGFYCNLPNHATLQSRTITNLNQNSDHYPVQLQLAPNTIIIKTKPTPNTNPRITYPISPTNLQNLITIFLDKQNLEILNLTNVLQQEKLTPSQWEEAQTTFQKIINSLSSCVEQTCMTKPTPPLPNRAKIQGGFLPRKQQKIWKSHLKTHHSIRKAIHAACHYHHTQLHNHPDIKYLHSLHNANIPPSPQTTITTNNGLKT